MSEYTSAVVKKRKLDSDSPCFERPIRISHLLILPEEMITNILSYVGTNVGEENPSDGENIVLNENLPDSTKEKFQLSMVCSRFNCLIKKPASWKRNNVLTINAKHSTISVGNGVVINGIFFPTNKAVQALGKLLGLARIKQLIVVDITQWAVNDDSKSLREGILQCFRKNEQRLKGTVDKLTMHGYLNDNNIRDLVLWLCNTLPNLRSVDLTVPVNDANTGQTFELKFEETEIANCPLEKVKLSRFQNSYDLLNILEGKRIQELIIKIKWYMQNGPETLIKITDAIADGTLEKLVIGPLDVHAGVMFLRINQWLNSTRSEVLCNLRHLEFNHVMVLDLENLPTILTLLPTSLVYLKIHCYNHILGNRIEVFRFLSQLIIAFFEKTAIQRGVFNFSTLTFIDEKRFKKYRKFAHRQWQGISVEEIISEGHRINYRFEKYGKYINLHIL